MKELLVIRVFLISKDKCPAQHHEQWDGCPKIYAVTQGEKSLVVNGGIM
jgi:hypothetical protein